MSKVEWRLNSYMTNIHEIEMKINEYKKDDGIQECLKAIKKVYEAMEYSVYKINKCFDSIEDKETYKN